MRVTADNLGMDSSMVNGLLAAHMISAGPWFSVFYMLSLTASAEVRGFVHIGLVRSFLSPLMVLRNGRRFGCLRGFRHYVATEVLGRLDSMRWIEGLIGTRNTVQRN